LSARGTLTLLNNALLSAHFPFADNSSMNCPHAESPGKPEWIGFEFAVI
jgi:hypothetical protein